MNKSQLAARLKEEGQSYEEIVQLLNLKSVDRARGLVSEGRDSREKLIDRTKPTYLIIPDTQLRPGVPNDHLYWAGRYTAERRPDLVIHLGDNHDMPSLSMYEQRGSKFHEGKRYRADIDAGNLGWERFEEGKGSFQPKRKIFLLGNHEYRIERAINADPRLEGVIGYHDFNAVDLGWEQIPFLEAIELEGIWFSHYFYARNTGRAYSGSMDSRLRTIGHSFVQGHQQGLQWGRRELNNGTAHVGLVAGSYYLHDEEYRNSQANNEWRGLIVMHEVGDGTYDPMMVSLDYLQRRYG